MADLTIDELARATGMTVRNIRSHQTRGLLPGPEMRGRVGFYGDEHIERLQLIRELQDDGLNLALVERLLTNRAEAANRLLSLRRTVIAPLEPGEPQVLTIDEITARFGEFTPADVERSMGIGALVLRDDGTFLAPLPELLDTAEEVMRHGVSLSAALHVAEQVRRACEEAAATFVEMVMTEVWQPFKDAGRPDDQWPQIASTIDSIRPLASEIFLEMLPPTIAAEIDRVFGEELRGEAEAGDEPGSARA